MINDADQTEHSPMPAEAERIEGEMLVAAAERIVPPAGNRRDQAIRFLAGARASGLDLSHTFAVIDRSSQSRPPWARQACFAIPGPGRTAMLLPSPPLSSGPETERDREERDVCIRKSLESLASSDVKLAQALPDPADTWACEAFVRAGLREVGDLAYLSLVLSGSRRRPPEPPSGVELRRAGRLTRGADDRRRLLDLLDRTYEGTLDCPELCGMRDIEDILDSHLSAGEFDERHWLIARDATGDVGCCLVSLTDQGATGELAYIGFAPEARGRGLARWLLQTSIYGLRATRAQRLVCAVDRRNAPAARLYESLGFREFASRRALVIAV